MSHAAPLELARLLGAPDTASREAAWDDLIARHTRLLISIARSFGGGSDEAMERYTYVLEKLREEDFRRIRAFQLDGRASFSTWLSVIGRRLCLDHYRARYGRVRDAADRQKSLDRRAARRRLADWVGVDAVLDDLPAEAESAEGEVIRGDRRHQLAAAIAALPAADRLLLTLRFTDDLSAIRIAALLELPTPFHVYRRLHAVLDLLRRRLTARGIDGSDG
ncbi:MAG: RNA polymerase sigma factor [Gemmatimonadales bacterium]